MGGGASSRKKATAEKEEDEFVPIKPSKMTRNDSLQLYQHGQHYHAPKAHKSRAQLNAAMAKDSIGEGDECEEEEEEEEGGASAPAEATTVDATVAAATASKAPSRRGSLSTSHLANQDEGHQSMKRAVEKRDTSSSLSGPVSEEVNEGGGEGEGEAAS